MNHSRRTWRLLAGLPRRAGTLLACGAAPPATPRAGSRPSDCNEHPSLPGHVSTKRVTIPNAVPGGRLVPGVR